MMSVRSHWAIVLSESFISLVISLDILPIIENRVLSFVLLLAVLLFAPQVCSSTVPFRYALSALKPADCAVNPLKP